MNILSKPPTVIIDWMIMAIEIRIMVTPWITSAIMAALSPPNRLKTMLIAEIPSSDAQ